jgi:hypothetical protein
MTVMDDASQLLAHPPFPALALTPASFSARGAYQGLRASMKI